MTVWTFIFSLVLLAPVAAAPRDDLLILVNRNVPEGLAVARHYQELRSIPDSHVVLLDLPASDVISRRDFEEQLRAPLIARMRASGWLQETERLALAGDKRRREPVVQQCRIRYLLPVYGMPWAIRDQRGRVVRKLERWDEGSDARDAAAVDSELALLLYDRLPLEGGTRNPVFRTKPGSRPDLGPLLLVSRWDGPSVNLVLQRMDETLAAEKTGLCGLSVFDTRGTREPGYRDGDLWMMRSALLLSTEGLPALVDAREALLTPSVPVGQGEVAWYQGWYSAHPTGWFADPGWRFAPGAVALHLHSLAGAAPRDPQQHWIGPLMERGAVATFGACYEPYLHGVPRYDLFTAYLLEGLPYAEAVTRASPLLSWQTVVVGDPLYRPFAQREAGGTPWHRARAMSRAEAGHPDRVLAWLRASAEETGDPRYRELEARVLLGLGRKLEASRVMESLVDGAGDLQVALRAAQLLSEQDPARHAGLAETLRERYGANSDLSWFTPPPKEP